MDEACASGGRWSRRYPRQRAAWIAPGRGGDVRLTRRYAALIQHLEAPLAGLDRTLAAAEDADAAEAPPHRLGEDVNTSGSRPARSVLARHDTVAEGRGGSGKARTCTPK